MWWNRYIGTPFKPFGRTLEGCDCWGLLRIVYREAFGIELPSYVSDYTATDARQELAGLIGQEVEANPWQEVAQGQERSGDAVLLALQGYPCHVGVVTEPGRMLHILKGPGAVIESYRGVAWSKRFRGIYRYAEPR